VSSLARDEANNGFHIYLYRHLLNNKQIVTHYRMFYHKTIRRLT